MAKAPLVNGRTARQIALVLENCTKRDCCNTCPYDSLHDRGKSCIDFMIADAALALRRLQKRYEKQRERYYIDKERIIREAMNRPLWVVYFTDPQYREVHMLGVFDNYDTALAYRAEREVDNQKAKLNLIIDVKRVSDRMGGNEK